MNILIVEDDPLISGGVVAFFKNIGHSCTQIADGDQAVLAIQANSFDFIILDIMLPKKSGLEILEIIRKTSDTPVLILTALSDDDTKISAFNNLADGFISKPFSLPVLAARVEAIHKRRNPTQNLWQYQNCKIDFSNYTATINNHNIKLCPKEFDVLKTLLSHKNQALTRTQIIEQTWNYDEEIPLERIVDAYIKSLRKKLALDCIKTIKNVGYKLELK